MFLHSNRQNVSASNKLNLCLISPHNMRNLVVKQMGWNSFRSRRLDENNPKLLWNNFVTNQTTRDSSYNQNKAFFLLHASVVDILEFKEILCFHSLSCMGMQIAFILKLKASLVVFSIVAPFFPLSFLWSPISLTGNTGIPSKGFPHSNRNTFCNTFKKTQQYFVFWNFCRHAWFYCYQ